MYIDQLLQDLDEILLRLEQPLSSEETLSGWTLGSKEHFRTFFTNLRKDLTQQKFPQVISISRGLDSFGITDGPILELAARISNKLRQLSTGDISE